MGEAWSAIGLGFELLAAMLFGAGVGWLIDQWRGSFPVGVAIGGGLGAVIGLYHFVRSALALQKKMERRARSGSSRPARAQPAKPPGSRADLFERSEPPDVNPEDDPWLDPETGRPLGEADDTPRPDASAGDAPGRSV